MNLSKTFKIPRSDKVVHIKCSKRGNIQCFLFYKRQKKIQYKMSHILFIRVLCLTIYSNISKQYHLRHAYTNKNINVSSS